MQFKMNKIYIKFKLQQYNKEKHTHDSYICSTNAAKKIRQKE